MNMVELLQSNLLTPPILFFVLGVFAGWIKSDLRVPDSISRYLSIYLMMAIGFKGGVAIAETTDFNADVLATIGAGIAFGFLQPFLGFYLLQLTTKLDRATAAAVSAHYGSISMVTFVTAVSFLGINQVAYAGFIVAVVALMEAPAIVSGLFLAHTKSAGNDIQKAQHPRLPLAEIMTNGAIVLLLGAFAVGYATGPSGMEKMHGFLVTPFHGVLALFLLDMGLVVAREASHLKMLTLRLAAFGIYMPILSALLAVAIAYTIGLDQGTAFLFVVLCASASYIAVPAAMRHALPEAKASVYIPLSLAITFPFNIILGLPAYFAITQTLFTR